MEKGSQVDLVSGPSYLSRKTETHGSQVTESERPRVKE